MEPKVASSRTLGKSRRLFEIIWGFLKIREVPIIRNIVFGVYIGFPYFGKPPFGGSIFRIQYLCYGHCCYFCHSDLPYVV